MIVLSAAIIGAAYRRWWGTKRPSWAFPGYRGLQAAAGLAALFWLCVFAGNVWWLAALKSALTIGFLAQRAQSLPIIWDAWKSLSEWLGRRGSHWLVFHWTEFAEAMAGAIVWTLVVSL